MSKVYLNFLIWRRLSYYIQGKIFFKLIYRPVQWYSYVGDHVIESVKGYYMFVIKLKWQRNSSHCDIFKILICTAYKILLHKKDVIKKKFRHA